MRLFLAGAILLISPSAFAQTRDAIATQTGQELNVSLGGYQYAEPQAPPITISGPKFGGEYTLTRALGDVSHWFVQGNARGTVGNATYNGACAPFLIGPNASSPNGYELDFGDFTPCSESGDRDWYLEGRAMVGKDFVGERWAWSPSTGIGVRYLSNGTTGTAGYRTDEYLYVPIGLTARTHVGSRRVRLLTVNVEYDRLLHGWQNTHDSQLGGAFIPATATTPAATLDSTTDISFSQTSGWAVRASVKFQLSARLSLEPSCVHWNVASSPVNVETATFTVNGVTAQEQLGAYEPQNTTSEVVVKLGFAF